MKIKFKLLACLTLMAMQYSSIIISEPSIAIMKNPEYLPITSYQNSLSDAISKFIAKYIYKKSKSNNPSTQVNNAATPVEKKQLVKLSREQALEAMKQVTSKLFDDKDSQHISIHLNNMKDLAIHLDDIIDKKTIAAIHFLLKNQHRSSIIDTLFWIKAIKEKELDTSIPMTPEVASKTGQEKLSVLQKKMKSPTIQNKKDQSVDQSLVVV